MYVCVNRPSYIMSSNVNNASPTGQGGVFEAVSLPQVFVIMWALHHPIRCVSFPWLLQVYTYLDLSKSRNQIRQKDLYFVFTDLPNNVMNHVD